MPLDILSEFLSPMTSVRRVVVNSTKTPHSNLLNHLPKSEWTHDAPDEVVISCFNRIMYNHVNVMATEVPTIFILGQR